MTTATQHTTRLSIHNTKDYEYSQQEQQEQQQRLCRGGGRRRRRRFLQLLLRRPPQLLLLLLLSSSLLLLLFPSRCWSFECFAASDGYVYPGSGTPTVATTSVLGRAVRDYLLDVEETNTNNTTTTTQTVRDRYGPTIGDWCVENVVAMDSIFYYLSSFNEDIGRWNVSSVTTMRGMFFAAPLFNQDIGGWDVSKVTNMKQMFRVARAFNQDIGTWNVSMVSDMSEMFFDAKAFNQSSIAGWNVSMVSDMSSMFEQAQSFRQNLCPWHDLLTAATVVDNMLLGTACPEPADPRLVDNNGLDNADGPFCVAACSVLPPIATPTTSASGKMTMTFLVGWTMTKLLMMVVAVSSMIQLF